MGSEITYPVTVCSSGWSLPLGSASFFLHGFPSILSASELSQTARSQDKGLTCVRTYTYSTILWELQSGNGQNLCLLAWLWIWYRTIVLGRRGDSSHVSCHTCRRRGILTKPLPFHFVSNLNRIRSLNPGIFVENQIFKCISHKGTSWSG